MKLFEIFGRAIEAFTNGMTSSVRASTLPLLDALDDAMVPRSAHLPNGDSGATMQMASPHGGYLTLSFYKLNDPSKPSGVAMRAEFAATNEQELAGLIDLLASGFAEMDSHALKQGWAN